MRPLRIGLVAPIWISVPPQTYGGTEIIVALLERHYREAGHHVTVFATGDSSTPSSLRSVMPRGLIDHMADGDANEYEHYVNALAADAVEFSRDLDVIHSHLGLAQLPILQLASCPIVQTVHAPLGVDDRWLASRCERPTIVALTAAQAAPTDRPLRVIHSGLDFGRFDPSWDASGPLVFLGRMGPGKNPLGAIEIAAAAGRRLVLAGAPQNAEERQYFAAEVAPRVDGEQVVYVGPVDHAGKAALLRSASALVFPIQANEAFGLVMVEAMACGTPVVATRHSSVPEIVDHGVTGVAADTVAELAYLVDDAVALDRRRVRAHAERRFSYTTMGDEYLALLASVCGGS